MSWRDRLVLAGGTIAHSPILSIIALAIGFGVVCALGQWVRELLGGDR